MSTTTTSTSIKALPLDKIEVDAGTQARVATDYGTVGEYATILEEGGTLPHGIAYGPDENGKIYAADGFHRHAAHIQADADAMRWELRPGGFLDALEYAVGANEDHGLRRTKEDCRRAIWLAMKHFPNWSGERIAQACKVSPATVSRARREFFEKQKEEAAEGEEVEPLVVVGTNQREYVIEPPKETGGGEEKARRLLEAEGFTVVDHLYGLDAVEALGIGSDMVRLGERPQPAELKETLYGCASSLQEALNRGMILGEIGPSSEGTDGKRITAASGEKEVEWCGRLDLSPAGACRLWASLLQGRGLGENAVEVPVVCAWGDSGEVYETLIKRDLAIEIISNTAPKFPIFRKSPISNRHGERIAARSENGAEMASRRKWLHDLVERMEGKALNEIGGLEKITKFAIAQAHQMAVEWVSKEFNEAIEAHGVDDEVAEDTPDRHRDRLIFFADRGESTLGLLVAILVAADLAHNGDEGLIVKNAAKVWLDREGDNGAGR